MCALLLISVTVKPAAWTDRVAAELTKRLSDQLQIEVSNHGSGIGVLASGESPPMARAFERSVIDALRAIEEKLSGEQIRAGLPRIQIDAH
jgi:hypothetical protein